MSQEQKPAIYIEDPDHGCRHCNNTGMVSYPSGHGTTTSERCDYCSAYAKKAQTWIDRGALT